MTFKKVFAQPIFKLQRHDSPGFVILLVCVLLRSQRNKISFAVQLTVGSESGPWFLKTTKWRMDNVLKRAATYVQELELCLLDILVQSLKLN